MSAAEPTAEQREAHDAAVFIVPHAVAMRRLAEVAALTHRPSRAFWEAMSALLRVNAVSCCKAAEHGWPGASLSCLQILMTLHLAAGAAPSCSGAPCAFRRVVLAKGHAAAAQYAVLHACGLISDAQLKRYKDGGAAASSEPHLEAHADLFCDTGSLGQSLSTAVGLAASDHLAADDGKEEGDGGLAITAVVLGDGELQEGQNYEALMTLFKLPRQVQRQLMILVDRNGFQSDSMCSEIKPICALEQVFAGFGFSSVVVEDGNSVHGVMDAVDAWRSAASASAADASPPPPIIICDTVKGFGTAMMQPERLPVTGKLWQPWHTRIFSFPQYAEFIDEQFAMARTAAAVAEESGVPNLIEAAADLWAAHVHRTPGLRAGSGVRPLVNSLRPLPPTGARGTGAAFGRRLCDLVREDKRVCIVSADLASSCGINAAAAHPRFFELGIAEQDAASFAAGLALGHAHPRQQQHLHDDGEHGASPSNGKGEEQGSRSSSSQRQRAQLIPVVCTYSNFLKRCYENIFINCVHGARVIYAGHYSGLCYHTDGKSHMSITDASSFAALPGLMVVDPLTPHCAERALDAAVSLLATTTTTTTTATDVVHSSDTLTGVYFRLRRTPCPAVEQAAADADAGSAPAPRSPFAPRVLLSGGSSRGNSSRSADVVHHLVVVMGAVAAKLALDLAAHYGSRAQVKVVAVPALRTVARDQAGRTPTREEWRDIVFASRPCRSLIVLEDDVGALCGAVADAMMRLPWTREESVKLVQRCTSEGSPSFRTLDDALSHFGFTVGSLVSELEME